MNELEMLTAAERLAALGYYLTPLRGKRPYLRNWPARGSVLQEQLRRCFRENLVNIGILTGKMNGIVVVDKDSKEAAEQFAAETECRMISETRKGRHFYFAHPGFDVPNAKLIDGDLRGENGVVVAPPSVVLGFGYRWVRGPLAAADLTQFRPEWLPARGDHVAHDAYAAAQDECGRHVGAQLENAQQHDAEHVGGQAGRAGQDAGRRAGAQDAAGDLGRQIAAARCYVKKIVATAGQGGHNATFRAVCKLRDAGMPEVDALAFLIDEWNPTNAVPPWTVKELLHKVRSAYARAMKGGL